MRSSAAMLTPPQVARLRLQGLGLIHGRATSLASPAAVVRHHLAMQAQDWNASRWAIGSRLPGAVDADVLAAYDRGEIVRTWSPRGTMHAVAAADVHWVLDLLGERALAGIEPRRAALGLDEHMLERAHDAAVQRLQGGRRCTRAELLDAIAAAGVDVGGQRGYHAILHMALAGTLVLGPTARGRQLFVLLDEWIPAARRLPRNEALAELARRYLAARGPARVDDLARWSRLGKRDCGAAIAANGDALVELDVGGARMLMTQETFELNDPDSPAAARSMLALAGFDEHLLGYGVRDEVLAPEDAPLIAPGGNGVFRWTIVDGGRVVGTWARERRGRTARVDIRAFAPLSRAASRRAVAAVAAWGVFAGCTVEVAR